MDDYTDQSNVVNEFLMKILAVKNFLRVKPGPLRPSRIDVFHAIGKRISKRLDTEDLEDDWLSQLIELEFEGENLSDTASHIARLLTGYVVNIPWVFHPETMRLKTRESTNLSRPQITVPPRSGREKHFILDYDNVVELLNQREVATNEAAQVTHVIVQGTVNDYLEKISKRSELIAESDALIGIAALSPIYREAELQNIGRQFTTEQKRLWPHGSTPVISTLIRSMETEEEFISQYRSHIELLGHSKWQRAEISFIPYHVKDDEAAKSSTMAYAKLLVDHGIDSLVSQINILQEKLGHVDQLLFIRLRSRSSGNWFPMEQGYAEVDSIDMEIIDGVVRVYGETREMFARYLDNALEPEAVRSFDILLDTLRPILVSLGITSFEPLQPGSLSAVTVLLHITALVVQSLCLMVQSYLRESVTPMHFEFLATPIDDFVLAGVSLKLPSSRVYASSRRLSCLGEMLEKKVLVFGPRESAPERLDLVATTAQIASLWGPTELIIRREQELTAIVGIKIQGGVIVPTGETLDGIQQWHWKSMNTTDNDEGMLISDTLPGIDLHTQIRIGGVGSRISLHPIGPATWNKDCPSSTKSILDLNPSFSSSLRVIGVKDPSIFLKSATVGLQGGQFVNFIAQGNYEATLGKTVKDQAINSITLFERNNLAYYDQMWGVFVSLCTGVMTRVRLRELLASFCLQWAAMEIPQLPGKSHEESEHAFIEALCGNDSLSDWIELLIPGPRMVAAKKRKHLQQQVNSLFLRVLEQLKDTGVSENGDLVLACLSKEKVLNSLTLSAKDHPWIKVLSDSSLTATFACLSLHCFQDSDCKCKNDKWNIPDEFRLATKLDLYRPSAFSRQDMQQDRVQAMRTYWINSPSLNLLARVVGCTRDKSGTVYYITIKNSVLPLSLVKYFRKRPMIRENDSSTAVKCIISGGSRYLRQLQRLKQQGKMKVHSA